MITVVYGLMAAGFFFLMVAVGLPLRPLRRYAAACLLSVLCFLAALALAFTTMGGGD